MTLTSLPLAMNWILKGPLMDSAFAILSVIFFHEILNLFKLVGIAVVVTGVAVMGRGGNA